LVRTAKKKTKIKPSKQLKQENYQLIEVNDKLIGIASILLTLIGTWFLALGLRIREGMNPKFRKKLGSIMKDKIVPSEVSQHQLLFRIGLGLITLGALLEIWTTYCR
jgi:hypothetical protein